MGRKLGSKNTKGLQVDEAGRQCTACFEYREWELFNFQKAGKCGRTSICKPCLAARSKAKRDLLNTGKPVKIVNAGGKECTKCKVYKPWSAFTIDKSTKDKHTSQCKPCRLEKFREWKQANPEKMKEAVSRWVERNIEHVREQSRKHAQAKRDRLGKEGWKAAVNAWNKENPEKLQAQRKRHYAVNRERLRAKQVSDRARRREAYRAYDAAKRAKRRSGFCGWANKEAIQAIYDLARYLSDETGVLHHVDHIVPLIHPLVQGLHVEHNLRVIPATENLQKSNKLIDV